MRLVVLEVPGLPPGMTQAQSFDFQTEPDRKIWVIGRQLGSDIHLVDASVSRRHAEATVHPDGLIIRDLESANGTYINQRPLPGNAPTLLRPGDRLRIGNVVTLLEAGPQKGIYSTTSGWADAQATMPFDRSQLPVNRASQSAQPQNSSMVPPPSISAVPDQPAFRPGAEPVQRQTEKPAAGPPAHYPALQPQVPAEAAPYQLPHSRPASAPVQPSSNQVERPSEQAYVPRPSEQNAARYERPPDLPFQPPFPRSNQSADNAPERVPFSPRVDVIPAKAAPVKKVERSRAGLPWLLIVPVLLGLLAVAGLVYFLTQTKPVAPAGPVVALPANVFNSPVQAENVLGLSLSRPTAWQRSDQGANSVLFFRPESASTVLYLEKTPGRTITNDKLTPQQALAQYIANVRAKVTTTQVAQDPASTTLKDGTPAFLTRLVFSTTEEPRVSDYNLAALSFKCQDILYFVSAANEAKDNTPALRQDLDAALANVTCAK